MALPSSEEARNIMSGQQIEALERLAKELNQITPDYEGLATAANIAFELCRINPNWAVEVAESIVSAYSENKFFLPHLEALITRLRIFNVFIKPTKLPA